MHLFILKRIIYINCSQFWINTYSFSSHELMKIIKIPSSKNTHKIMHWFLRLKSVRFWKLLINCVGWMRVYYLGQKINERCMLTFLKHAHILSKIAYGNIVQQVLQQISQLMFLPCLLLIWILPPFLGLNRICFFCSNL